MRLIIMTEKAYDEKNKFGYGSSAAETSRFTSHSKDPKANRKVNMGKGAGL